MDLIDLKNMPLTNPDYVSRAVVEQIIWERDTAIWQLRQLGYGFGEEIRTDGDIISRQAAVIAVTAGSISTATVFGRTEEGMTAAKEIIRAIKSIPSAQPEQRWIPCSERLPEIKEHHVSDPCIVYCNNHAYGFAELEENIFGQVGWNCERDDEYHEPLGEVLAWMPLPEPWRGEEHE